MELTPHYETTITCIHCKKDFPSAKLRSKFVRIKKHESDFQPIYVNPAINGIYYNVFVCEHCGFSFTEDFSRYFAPGTEAIIQTQIVERFVRRSYNGERTVFQALEAYKLALVCGNLKKEKNVVLAGLAMRIAWLYRSLDNEGQEQRFMNLSRDYYVSSYSTGDYSTTQMSEFRILYMIGELSRRINDLEEATRSFSRILEQQNSCIEPKIIAMTKEQWLITREAK